MPEFREIYAAHPREYHALVSAEDVEGNLSSALGTAVGLCGARVVEVGAGTGRLTRLFLEAGATVLATDAAPAMLCEARRQLTDVRPSRWRLAVADCRRLPVASGVADFAVAGWVLGHFTGWHPESWAESTDTALDEMMRVVGPGRVVTVIETLGTAVDSPAPPTAALASFYASLERRGFAKSIIRTDYAFPSVAAAARSCGFFFGAEISRRVAAKHQRRVPEFTGIWTLRL